MELPLIERRHKVHAHSDLEQWRVTPWRSAHVELNIAGEPWPIIEPEQLERFLGMTDKLAASIRRRQKEILDSY